MKATAEDIVEINQLLSLWGHILDSHQQERYGEVLTEDAYYDCSIFGFEPVKGIEGVRGTFQQDGHAKAHHTTNVFVEKNSDSDTELNVISKGLGLLGNGSVSSLTFIDIVRLTPNGWRLASRILKF